MFGAKSYADGGADGAGGAAAGHHPLSVTG